MISKAEFLRLADVDQDPAVSIYLPVAPEFPQRAKNDIRLRNLLGDAIDQLCADGGEHSAILQGLRSKEMEKLRIEDRSVRGYAVFATADGVETLPLPVSPVAAVVVQRGYHVAPLVAALDDNRRFYVISVDHQRARLFAADRFGLRPLGSPQAERTLSEIRQVTELPAEVGFHSTGTAPSGRPEARHHAQGDSPADYRQIQLDQYARAIGAATDDILGSETAPLVPVGEANFLGMFRKHCRYRGLTTGSVVKSPSSLTMEKMHDAAADIAEERLRSPAAEARARFDAGRNRDDGTVLVDTTEIMVAAAEGRIETAIFDRIDGPRIGLCAAESCEEADRPARRRICDVVAAQTLRQGGEIVLLSAGELSSASGMAAILRYGAGASRGRGARSVTENGHLISSRTAERSVSRALTLLTTGADQRDSGKHSFGSAARQNRKGTSLSRSFPTMRFSSLSSFGRPRTAAAMSVDSR